MIIDAIKNRYGVKEGLTVKGDSIIEWPYLEPRPSKLEVKELLESFNLEVKNIKEKKDEYKGAFDVKFNAKNSKLFYVNKNNEMVEI